MTWRARHQSIWKRQSLLSSGRLSLCDAVSPVSLDLPAVFERDGGSLDFNVFSLKKSPLKKYHVDQNTFVGCVQS